jgi:hypothetical protein
MHILNLVAPNFGSLQLSWTKPALLSRDLSRTANLPFLATCTAVMGFLSSISVVALASCFQTAAIGAVRDSSGEVCTGHINLPTNLTMASSGALPAAITAAEERKDAAAIEQIRNTLALYPLIIDGKDFASLSLVFIADAVANYSAPLNVISPLRTIRTVL